MLREILDEIREEVSWAVRNDRVIVAAVPLLKGMANDPTADDWGERLVIERGTPGPVEPTHTNSHVPIIRELLDTTELNLDCIEDATRQIIERAREFVDGESAMQAEASSNPGPAGTPQQSAHDGRLF